MSNSLYWRPLVETHGNDLPFGLKRILAKRYFGHDGSLNTEHPVGLAERDIPYGGVEIWTAE